LRESVANGSYLRYPTHQLRQSTSIMEDLRLSSEMPNEVGFDGKILLVQATLCDSIETPSTEGMNFSSWQRKCQRIRLSASNARLEALLRLQLSVTHRLDRLPKVIGCPHFVG
jgi:hypothetical protein